MIKEKTEQYKVFNLLHNITFVQRETIFENSHLGIFINCGSRNETPSIHGISHLIEHAVFKATKYKKSHQILSELDNVGGELNAYTSKEETCFHASFRNIYYKKATELLVEIGLNATFPNNEVAKEKKIIVEEIHAYEDQYNEHIMDEFDKHFFNNHPLAHPILGSEKSLKNIEVKQMFNYLQKHYIPKNIVIVSVSNIPIEKQINWLNHYLSRISFKTKKTIEQKTPFKYTPFSKVETKNSSQLHAIIGFPAFSVFHKKKYAFALLNNIIGGPAMNSLLNLQIREKNAWVYEINSSYNAYKDCGQFTIYFGCDRKNLTKVKKNILKVLSSCATTLLSERKLNNYKNQLIGQLLLSNESAVNDLFHLGKSFLNHNKSLTIKQLKEELDVISPQEIKQVAIDIFVKQKVSELIYMPNQDD